MAFLAIMQVADNRVAKYMDFDTQAQADEHVANHSGAYPDAFVHESPHDPEELYIDVGNVVTHQPIVIPPPTDDERFALAFPEDPAHTNRDRMRMIFEGMFELAGRVAALEGGSAPTREEFKTWLKAKLP